MRDTPFAALTVGGFLVVGFLSACSSAGDNPLTVFADPAKYQYYDCDMLAGQRTYWKGKEQELKLLMDKAEKGTGGSIVNVIAYQADYVAAAEEVKVIDATARIKKCPAPK